MRERLISFFVHAFVRSVVGYPWVLHTRPGTVRRCVLTHTHTPATTGAQKRRSRIVHMNDPGPTPPLPSQDFHAWQG